MWKRKRYLIVTGFHVGLLQTPSISLSIVNDDQHDEQPTPRNKTMAAAARNNDDEDSSSESSDEDNSVSSSSVKDDEEEEEEEAGRSSSSETSSADHDDDDGENGSVVGSTRSSSSSSTNSGEDPDDDEMQDDDDFDQPEEDGPSTTNVSARQTAKGSRATSNPSAPTMLSKSWKALSTHVPMYTGGKFVVVPPLPRATETAPQGSTRSASTPLVLLPVGGNVALVNLRSGTVVSKLRSEAGGAGAGAEGEDDDDDDDGRGHDPDSITAFDGTSGMVVTCSHNSILRQYSIQYRRSEDDDDGKKNGAAMEENVGGEGISSVATGTKLARTIGRSGHALPVTVVKFHPSGVFFATGSLDGTVRVWDVRGMYCTHSFRWGSASEGAGVRSGVTCISWRDGAASMSATTGARRQKELQVAIGREDGSIVVHDLMGRSAEAKPVAVLHDHVGAVTCISWLDPEDVRLDPHPQFQKQRGSASSSPSSSSFVLVSAGRDAVLNLWINDKSIHTLPVYEQVEGLEVFPVDGLGNESDDDLDGGRVMLATAGSKGVVRIWKITASLRIEPVAVQVSGTSSADRGGYVAMQQYRDDHTIGNEESDRTSTRLITANAEHNLSVVDSNTLETTSSLVGHLDDILDVRMLPSRNDSDDAEIGRTATVALATNSAEIRLMTVATSPDDIVPESSTSDTLSGHTAAVLCLDVSPCHRFLLSCGKDRSVRVWDLARQQCVGVAAGHTEAVGAAAFSRRIVHFRNPTTDVMAFCVSVSVDRTLKRWNLPRSLLLTSENPDPVSLSVAGTVRAHEKDINMVSVAPNDSMIATASQDKTVRLWNASDLSLRATLKGHRRGVWDVQFSPVDRVVVTASGDKTLKLWSLTDYACVRYVL
jgi:U3 small nucleolar RNA-associated protein 13